jgi:hypothetical protein
MDNPLTNLRETIKQHWQQYRPKMCAELTAKGRLEIAIDNAANRTIEAVMASIDKGIPLLDAWEQVREEWAILPAEEDEPDTFTEPEPDDDTEDDYGEGDEAPIDDGEWIKRFSVADEALSSLLEAGELPNVTQSQEGVWFVADARCQWKGDTPVLAVMGIADKRYLLNRTDGKLQVIRVRESGRTILSETALTPTLSEWLRSDSHAVKLTFMVWAVLEIGVKEGV